MTPSMLQRRREPIVGRASALALVLLVLWVTACTSSSSESDTADASETAAEAASPDDDGEGSSGGEEDSQDAAADQPEVAELLVGILPTVGYAPVVLADEEGFFAEEGLTVELTNPAAGGALSGVVGGTYQFAGVNWVSFVLAVNEGLEVEPVIELERGVPHYAELLVSAESEFETLADLTGEDVAVVAAPGNCDVIPIDALQQEGITEQPNFVTLSVPDMPGAVQRGDVAAACVPEPLLGDVLGSGDFRSVFDLFAGPYEGFMISGMVTSRSFAEANPNTVAAFQRAVQRAAELPEEAIRDVLPVYTSLSEDQAANVRLPSFPGGLDLDSLATTTEIMNRIGIFGELQPPGEE